MPQEGVTHVAWQVGHLAFAQYRLALLRVRGARPDDGALIAPEFLAVLGADTVADRDAARYPSPAEIRAVFDRVHHRVLEDLARHPEADLDSPVPLPHPIAKTKRAEELGPSLVRIRFFQRASGGGTDEAALAVLNRRL